MRQIYIVFLIIGLWIIASSLSQPTAAGAIYSINRIWGLYTFAKLFYATASGFQFVS